LAIGLPITMNVRNVYAVGDIALVIADWSLMGTGVDGSEVDMSGGTADVARRGPDGWKFIVDNPFGTG
jgi:ketosteroid isomerase-like protein